MGFLIKTVRLVLLQVLLTAQVAATSRLGYKFQHESDTNSNSTTTTSDTPTSGSVDPAIEASKVNPPSLSNQFCSLTPGSYRQAASTEPALSQAVTQLQQYGIASWYTDNAEYASTLQQLLASCDPAQRLVLVVYGLPNKDCEAQYSNRGTNKDPSAYQVFIQTLVDAVGQRKVLYVLEPDAVGLLANPGGCAQQSGYKENLQQAIQLLSRNPNADLYLDVGYWTLSDPQTGGLVANMVKELATATGKGGRLKGITLNTSNYRPTSEMVQTCSTFQQLVGGNQLHCIIDTSRNFGSSRPSKEWCNSKSAGIGDLPTSTTGFPNIDYFIWIKPPGESDGTCDGKDRTNDAMRGPPAGQFFVEHFKSLWNNGIFVQKLGQNAIA